MICYICQKRIKLTNSTNDYRKDKKGIAHPTCFKANSILDIRPLDVEKFVPSGSINPDNSKDIIEKNIIGNLNE